MAKKSLWEPGADEGPFGICESLDEVFALVFSKGGLQGLHEVLDAMLATNEFDEEFVTKAAILANLRAMPNLWLAVNHLSSKH